MAGSQRDPRRWVKSEPPKVSSDGKPRQAAVCHLFTTRGQPGVAFAANAGTLCDEATPRDEATPCDEATPRRAIKSHCVTKPHHVMKPRRVTEPHHVMKPRRSMKPHHAITEATLPRDEVTPRDEATPGARHSLRDRLTRMFTPCQFKKPSLGLFLRPGQITCCPVWGRIHAPRARINSFSLLLSAVRLEVKRKNRRVIRMLL